MEDEWHIPITDVLALMELEKQLQPSFNSNYKVHIHRLEAIERKFEHLEGMKETKLRFRTQEKEKPERGKKKAFVPLVTPIDPLSEEVMGNPQFQARVKATLASIDMTEETFRGIAEAWRQAVGDFHTKHIHLALKSGIFRFIQAANNKLLEKGLSEFPNSFQSIADSSHTSNMDMDQSMDQSMDGGNENGNGHGDTLKGVEAVGQGRMDENVEIQLSTIEKGTDESMEQISVD
tara:strand:- start:494 stop:1195 length:702 start_codon:yes stop_codon:yes gene_type:complete